MVAAETATTTAQLCFTAVKHKYSCVWQQLLGCQNVTYVLAQLHYTSTIARLMQKKGNVGTGSTHWSSASGQGEAQISCHETLGDALEALPIAAISGKTRVMSMQNHSNSSAHHFTMFAPRLVRPKCTKQAYKGV